MIDKTEYFIGVLYLERKDMLEHMNWITEQHYGSYSPSERKSTVTLSPGVTETYDYVSGTDIMEFCTKEWDGFICLKGSYDSKVINFAVTRIRRVCG